MLTLLAGGIRSSPSRGLLCSSQALSGWVKQTQSEDSEERGWKHMDVTILFIS